MKKILLSIFFMVLIPELLFAQIDLTKYKLIASYPLQTDGKDITGMNSNMNLEGLYTFKDGGIYSNGIYEGANSCWIGTPTIDSMNLNDFIVILDFKIDIIPNRLEPVFLIGELWRFLGVSLNYSDSTMFLFKNGAELYTKKSSTKYSSKTWFTLALKHKQNKTTVFINNKPEITDSSAIDLGNNFYDATHRRVFNAHTGMGKTFKGYWRNLKIYSYSNSQTSTEILSLSESLNVYPNPSDGLINVDFSENSQYKSIILSITNQSGQKLYNGKFQSPRGKICLNTNLPAGLYFLNMIADSQILKWKVVIK
jgi:Secretion system C-terminal sorting domain